MDEDRTTLVDEEREQMSDSKGHDPDADDLVIWETLDELRI